MTTDTMPTLSLCMIVKNEEEQLPGCLESIHGLVDQIIVVDTGSSDRTVDIARAFGAEIAFFPWCDDFAAARNESLRHARGDWIIWLDADERINCPGAGNCLLNAACAQGIDAYWVPIRNPKQDEGCTVHHAIRLFRHFSGIHFVGAVHELVDPFLIERGAKIGRASFVIEHLGYAIEPSQMEEKLRRNLTLLRKSVEKEPDNAFTLYGMGRTVLGLGEEDEALTTLQRALQGKGMTTNLRASILNLISYIHLNRRDYSEAAQTARDSLHAVENQNIARLLLGIAHYSQKHYDLALPYLFQAYQFQRLPPERRCTEVAEEHSYSETDVLRALAVSYGNLGRYGEAIAFFRRYLKIKDRDAEMMALLGVCYLNAQDAPQAVLYLKQAEELGFPIQRIGLPLACACFKLGDLTQTQKYLLELGEESLMSENAQALLDSMVNHWFSRNLIHEACTALGQLASKYPFHAKILDALGVACIKAGDFSKSLEVHKRLATLDPGNPDVIRRLAGLYLKLGDTVNARECLSRLGRGVA